MSDNVNCEIKFKSFTSKEFSYLPQEIKKKDTTKIDLLYSNPLPKEVTKLKGKNDYYLLRFGIYRIVYELHAKDRSILNG